MEHPAFAAHHLGGKQNVWRAGDLELHKVSGTDDHVDISLMTELFVALLRNRSLNAWAKL